MATKKANKESKRDKLRKEAKALGLTGYSRLGAGELEKLIEETKNPAERVKQIVAAAVTIEDSNGITAQVVREGEITKITRVDIYCGDVLSYQTAALVEALDIVTSNDTLLTHAADSEQVDILWQVILHGESDSDTDTLGLLRDEDTILTDVCGLDLVFAVDDVKQLVDILKAEYQIVKKGKLEQAQSKLP